MRLKVTYDDGSQQEMDAGETVFIRAHPPSETPKPGYERTREYPPEFCKFTSLRASVLTVGAHVSLGGKVVRVRAVEHLD
jgi:hypothetical protein